MPTHGQPPLLAPLLAGSAQVRSTDVVIFDRAGVAAGLVVAPAGGLAVVRVLALGQPRQANETQ